MYERMNNNQLYLAGTIVSDPVFSHEIYGEGFYELYLEVKRLSEQTDILPVTLSERLISENELRVGSKIGFYGQFRSYNKIEEGRSRLMLTVFVRETEEFDESKNPNWIQLTGYVCKQPIYRTTPFSREITDVLLAVNRAYNKSDYIPCITWGRNARYARGLQVGEQISIAGRIQSRVYQKRITETQSEQRTAYEISVARIVSGEFPPELSMGGIPMTAELEEHRPHVYH
ncbi:MAG: single-stranded DNA-binding protein [Clostridia bacterium]|nr:single-stranded DNA-binding protein [Clostridia bacterium]